MTTDNKMENTIIYCKPTVNCDVFYRTLLLVLDRSGEMKEPQNVKSGFFKNIYKLLSFKS